MIRFRRGIPLFSVALVVVAVAIIAAAALTSWWVLLALIPLAMVVGCVTMVVARRRVPGGPAAARCGCGAASGRPGATYGCRSPRSERTADVNV